MKYLILVCSAAVMLTACNGNSGKHVHLSAEDSLAMKANPMLASMTAGMDKMMSMKMSGDPDYDFAAMMIAHHQAAIDMSLVEIEKGTDPAIVEMAKAIKLAQVTEISRMEAYLRSRTDIDGLNLSKEQEPEAMSGMMSMMDAMKGVKKGTTIDHDFVRMMIPHHQGAVQMSNDLLKNGKSAEMKTLANAIIAAQTAEINSFNQWLSAHP
ncbi:MAG: hypothetical protein JWQ27_3207 [Ferruginibacter sp.]|nr:hypothetical protein [Ferruginibacter sp.]